MIHPITEFKGIWGEQNSILIFLPSILNHLHHLTQPQVPSRGTVTNTTSGSTGQVQLNGGDGQVAQLNGFVCNVNGNPSDTKISGAYPQLSVTGNGYIYAYAVPTTPGTASPLTSLDLYYEGTAQTQDTANPAAYYWMLVATISNYQPGWRRYRQTDLRCEQCLWLWLWAKHSRLLFWGYQRLLK